MDDRAIFFKNYLFLLTEDKLCFVSLKNKLNEALQSYSYKDFRNHLNIFCHLCFRLVYITWGLIQFFTIWGGLTKVFPHSNIILPFISIVLAFIPAVGPLLGLICAHACWGWGLFYSAFFFITPYFLVNSPLQMIALFEFYKDWLRWQAEEKALNPA